MPVAACLVLLRSTSCTGPWAVGAHSDIAEFELWRNKQMQKQPKASTLQNFASAWSKVIATAVEHGYISERVPVPRMQVKGTKSQPRAAFTESEVAQLRSYMATWVEGSSKANKSTESDMRHLLRDYIEMLLFTGMRHGTEALGVRWKDVCWHTQGSKRYLRIWVNGKTGGRWLIAKHAALAVLERLHARQAALKSLETGSSAFLNLLTHVHSIPSGMPSRLATSTTE
jgi:integrase